MSAKDPNVSVTANVMLLEDPATGRERTEREQGAFVPGDLAAIQNSRWHPVILDALTPIQRIEYEQYLPCIVCHRVSGLCNCKAQ